MSEELNQGHGGRISRLETDVTSLKEDFATVKADLRAFGSILGEIKQSLNSSRPAWYVLLPILLSFFMVVAGGILAFSSLKSDVAGLYSVKSTNDKMEQRQWDMNSRISRLEGKSNVPAETPSN
jgi:hypothetical protein